MIRFKSSPINALASYIAFSLVVSATLLSPIRTEDEQRVPTFKPKNENESRGDKNWISFKSEQTTKVIIQGRSVVESHCWTVEELFSPSEGVSFNTHLDIITGHTFVLISERQRNFYLTPDAEGRLKKCSLDHRQDHTTLFPWRYTSIGDEDTNSLEISKSYVALGVVALWINAELRPDLTKCSINKDENELVCELSDEERRLKEILHFEWPLDNEDAQTKLLGAKLKKVRVDRQQVVRYSASNMILEDIVVDIEIKNSEVKPISKETRQLLKEHLNDCRDSLTRSDLVFPSLIRQMTQSSQRNYYFSYFVEISDQIGELSPHQRATRSKSKPSARYKIEDWFSYEAEKQNLLFRDLKLGLYENLLRIFSMRDIKSGKTAGYRIGKEKRENKKPQCELAYDTKNDLFHDQLVKLSNGLMVRKMLFSRPGKSPGSRQLHSGDLFGLGALLMNLADLPNKRIEVPLGEDGKAEKRLVGDRFVSSVEWVVDLSEEQKVHIMFASKNVGEDFECSINDLYRIEFRKLRYSEEGYEKRGVKLGDKMEEIERQLGGVKSDDYDVIASDGGHLNYMVELSIDVIEYSNYLYEREMRRIFEIPETCTEIDTTKALEPSYEPELDPLFKPTRKPTVDGPKFDEDFSLAHEFPTYSQYMNLIHDHVISSEWTFDNGTRLEVKEYFMLDGTGKLDSRFSRMDMIRREGKSLIESYSLYMQFESQSIIRHDKRDGSCKMIFRPDSWLVELASCRLKSNDDSGSTKERGEKPETDVADDWDLIGLDEYGIVGLWKRASRSPYVEYLGEFRKDKPRKSSSKYALWALSDDPDFGGIDIIFVFEIQTREAIELNARYKLTSIEMKFRENENTNFVGVRQINIGWILVEPGKANALDFVVPSVCHADNDWEDHTKKVIVHPKVEFPSFVKTLRGDSPAKATFELEYDLLVNDDSGEGLGLAHPLHLIETNDVSTELSRLIMTTPGGIENDLESDKVELYLWLKHDKHVLIEQANKGGNNRCKAAHSAAAIFHFDDTIEYLSSKERKLEEAKSNFLIANIWHLFSELIDINKSKILPWLEVKFVRRLLYNKAGQRRRAFQWSFVTENRIIKFTFKLNEKTPKSTSNLVLHEVELSTPHQRSASARSIRLRFIVSRIATSAATKTKSRYLSRQSKSCDDIKDRAKFPLLSDMVKMSPDRIMFMKSIHRVEDVEEGPPLFVQHQEWLNLKEGLYRSIISLDGDNSRHLSDHLISSKFKEYFDLSKEFDCELVSSSDLLRLTNIRVEDWLCQSMIVGLQSFKSSSSPGEQLVGPLAWWMLASQPEMDVQAALSEPQLGDLLLSGGDAAGSDLKRLFMAEEWTVRRSMDRNGPSTLRLRFVENLEHRIERPSDKTAGSLILEEIRVLERYSITVINYVIQSHQTQTNGMAHISSLPLETALLIPKHRGCKRSTLAKQSPDLKTRDNVMFAVISSMGFEYEASMKVFDILSASMVPKKVVLSGKLSRCPKFPSSTPMNSLRVIQDRRHFLNGTLRTYRWTIEQEGEDKSRRSPLFHGIPTIESYHKLIDDVVGVCLIYREQLPSDETLRLHFDDSGGNANGPSTLFDRPVVLSLGRDSLLSMDSNKFEQIQLNKKISENDDAHKTEVVYELRVPKLSLSELISGDAIVTRTYERGKGDESYMGIFHQSSLKIEVFMPRKLHLTIQVKNYGYEDCFDMIDEAGNEQCSKSLISNFDVSKSGSYDDVQRLRTFKLIFKPQGEPIDNQLFELQIPKIMKDIRGMLLQIPAQLWPTQLGQMTVNFGRHDGTISARFNLLEPPTAIDQFVELPGRRIKLAPSLGTLKFLGSRYACSAWCDTRNDCLALSYCKNSRSCSIVSHHAIIDIITDEQKASIINDQSNSAELRKIFKLEDASECSFWWSSRLQPRHNLNEVSEFFKTKVEEFGKRETPDANFAIEITSLSSGRDELKRIIYEVYEFSEETDEVANLEKEFDSMIQSEDNEQLKAHGIANSGGPSLVLFKSDHSIELAKLSSQNSLVYKTSHVNKQMDCLSACEYSADCQFVSFCTGSSTCSMVGGLTSWQQVETLSEPSEDCTIYSHDFLLDFHEFADSREPKSSGGKYVGLNLLECAAKCNLIGLSSTQASDDCLSFDFCHRSRASGDEISECYIQADHVSMGNFDDTKLVENKDRKDQNKARCSHYSKSLLATFIEIPRSALTEHRSTVFTRISIDNCALMCRRDMTCLAFEFCKFLEKSSEKSHLRSSCTFLRSDAILRPDEASNLNLDGSTTKKPQATEKKVVDLKSSSECSVYKSNERLRRLFDTIEDLLNSEAEVLEKNWRVSWFSRLNVLIASALASVIVGIFAHLIYKNLLGRRFARFR